MTWNPAWNLGGLIANSSSVDLLIILTIKGETISELFGLSSVSE